MAWALTMAGCVADTDGLSVIGGRRGDAGRLDAGDTDAAVSDGGPATTSPFDCIDGTEPPPRPAPPCALDVSSHVLASPRASALGERAALHFSGGLAAPDDVYERTRHEACRIFRLEPALRFIETTPAPGLVLELTAAAAARVAREDWPALTCLNEAYGYRVARLGERPPYPLGLESETRLRRESLAPLYESLAGVLRANVYTTLPLTEPSFSVCFALRADGTHVYRIERRLEPCALQCERTVVDVFEGRFDGAVRRVARWDSATGAPYPSEATISNCGGALSGSESLVASGPG